MTNDVVHRCNYAYERIEAMLFFSFQAVLSVEGAGVRTS
jgi:hypothetical protein